MSANPNFDAIASSTRRFYANGKFAQQVYNGRILMAWMQKNGVVQTWDGGDPIVEPLLTAENTTIRSQASFDEADFTPQDGLDAAQFQGKLYTETVVLDWVTKWKNSGSNKVIDIWNTKMMQAKESFAVRLNQDLFLDGTTNATDLTGLAALVGNTGTYGNIARSGNTFWQAYVEGTAGPLTEDDMRIATNTVGRNLVEFKPDLIITTQALFQKYESLVLPAYRTEDRRVGDLGFASLQWNGIPISWDEKCQSGRMYFLNSKVLHLRPHVDANMDMTERRNPQKQLVDGLMIYWYGNLTSSGCRYTGVLTGRTA